MERRGLRGLPPLYADLAGSEGTTDRDPLAELLRTHREGTAAFLALKFSAAFRHPLNPEQMELAPLRWEEVIRKTAPLDSLQADIARWQAALESAQKETNATKRIEAETEVYDDMYPALRSCGFEIAAIVKGLLESPPSDEQKKTTEAMLKRLENSK